MFTILCSPFCKWKKKSIKLQRQTEISHGYFKEKLISRLMMQKYQLNCHSTYLSMFLVKIEFFLEIHQMMVMMMIHHRCRVEDKLYINSSSIKRDFCVTFTATILEANSSLFLWSITKPSESDLQMFIWIVNSMHDPNLSSLNFLFQ